MNTCSLYWEKNGGSNCSVTKKEEKVEEYDRAEDFEGIYRRRCKLIEIK